MLKYNKKYTKALRFMRDLYDLIRYLQNGTRLHIGVFFFGSFGNEKCRLPHAHTIHSSPVCTELKKDSGGFRRCFRCRNMALRKALESKRPFGGLCTGGVFEYTHPVLVDGEVAAVIFIGNILAGEGGNARLLSRLGARQSLLSTMEDRLTAADAAAMAEILDSYIRLLLKEGADALGEKKYSLIDNVKSYIRESTEFDLGMEHIAAVFHYNKSYLGRIFKEETGMSIARYLQNVRIARAKEMLLQTRLPVIEIAARCGFSDVAYFIRVFKVAERMTPTEFRRGKNRPED